MFFFSEKLLLLSLCDFISSNTVIVCHPLLPQMCFFFQFSPCLNTHFEVIIKWLESWGAYVFGVEVRWCAVVLRSPWEFNYTRTPCRRKAQAPTHTHTDIHTTAADSSAEKFARWDRSPDDVIGFLRCVPTLLKVMAGMNATDTTPPNRSIVMCARMCVYQKQIKWEIGRKNNLVK